MKFMSLLSDEYTFFRGTADEFYRLCGELCPDWLADRSAWVQLHGDVHIGNVGTYQGEGPLGRDIRFSLVDPDETAEGPFQLDLLRALTAIRLASAGEGRSLDEPGVGAAATSLCDGYRGTLTGTVSYEQLTTDRKSVVALLKRASSGDARKYVDRYADLSASPPRFRPARLKNGQVNDLMEPVSADQRSAIIDAVGRYWNEGCNTSTKERFRVASVDGLQAMVLDAVRWTRVGSSGSQGLHKYLILLDHPLKDGDGLLILKLKEEPAPAAARVGLLPAAGSVRRAVEVAAAYPRLLPNAPCLIGHTRLGDRGFLVSMKDPWGEEFEPEDFNLNDSPERVNQSASLLGEVVGLAHRNSILSTRGEDALTSIAAKLNGLDVTLRERSGVVADHLHAQFQALQNDSEARELAEKARKLVRDKAGQSSP